MRYIEYNLKVDDKVCLFEIVKVYWNNIYGYP